MDKKSQTLETYNRAAQPMADKFNALGPRVRDISQTFSYVQKENPFVFEIGCGNGRDAKEILKRTKNYLGIDYSAALLAMAKAEVPEARFELADIEGYEVPPGIDIVFAFASLLHTDKMHVQEILARLYNALNSGGVVFLSLRHAPYKEEDVTDTWGTRTFYFYTPEELSRLEPRFRNIFQHIHLSKDGKEWFELILQK